MFIGEYSHNVDAKGRLIMPSKFREMMQDTICMTKGMDGCILVYEKDEFYNLNIKNLGLASKEARWFSRIFYTGAKESSYDKQGRILIPQNLLEYAAITKEVIVAGVTNRIEIWSKERWEAFMDMALPEYDNLLDQLTDRDV